LKREFGEGVGVSQPALGRFERGETSITLRSK
jgi:hypothetical protein